RMWFLHQLEPGSAVYNIPFAYRHQGPLDVGVLRQALDEIVRRHESLRTTFAVEGGDPVQVVAAERTQRLEVVDLRPLPEDQRLFAGQRLAFTEALTPFDLARGPLLRTTLLTLADADCVLLLTMHHIVSDGWSVRVRLEELATLLSAFGAGEPSPLPELPTQYSAYARAQRDRLKGPVLDGLLAYWRDRLAGAPAVIELPLDRPRPKLQRYLGATLPVTFSAELLRGLRALARDHDATLFMVLLAGFGLTLHRYCGQPDLVIGTPVALREKAELEPLVGLFVNTLALRLGLSGPATVADLIAHVVDVTVDAFSHQELPFERLVEDLQPERSLSHQPLVQVVLSLQNALIGSGPAPPAADAPAPDAAAPPPAAAPIPSTAKFDLTLALAESEEGLTGGVEYNVDLFDGPTIARFVEALRPVLTAMAADPPRRLAEVPLLHDAECQQILRGLNPPPRAWDSDATMVERIWDQARAGPDQVAVIVDGGSTGPYPALAGPAEPIALRLRERGVERGQLVPVCLRRSGELLATLLGVLRAGA